MVDETQTGEGQQAPADENTMTTLQTGNETNPAPMPEAAPPTTPPPTGLSFDSVEAEVAWLKTEVERLTGELKDRTQRLADLLHHPDRIPLFERIEQAIKHVVDTVRNHL